METQFVRFVTLVFAATCFVSFMWAVKGHFRSEGKIPLGMRLISVLSMVGFAWFTWDFTCAVYAERQASTWANAAAWVLFLVDFTLFWWTVRVNAAHPLTLAFSIDQPSFLQQAGPYRFVRHPFYFSYVVFWIATAVASSNAVHWVMPIVMVVLYREAALREEAKFAQSPFSAAYTSYQVRTGMLMPRLSLTGAVE